MSSAVILLPVDRINGADFSQFHHARFKVCAFSCRLGCRRLCLHRLHCVVGKFVIEPRANVRGARTAPTLGTLARRSATCCTHANRCHRFFDGLIQTSKRSFSPRKRSFRLGELRLRTGQFDVAAIDRCHARINAAACTAR